MCYLAESDLVYTETLIQRGKIDYTGKDVLILGAGDGALLWELLKESPNMVTMVEIDETVMKLCSQHLRSACGSALDSIVGPHHRIVIGDCLAELDKLKSENVQFDFVFSDLTDIPLSTTPQNKEWQFLLDKLATTLRFFDRGDFFTLHGQDALLASRDYFKTHSVVKMLGFGAKKLESVALNRNHFENFAREVLLVKNYCIEIFCSKGSKNDWVLQSQASPGNLTQVEDLIFANTDITNSVGILAFKIGLENQVGCCYVDTNERKFLVAQFADNDSFSNLESLIVQLSPKEVLIPPGNIYAPAKAVLKRHSLLVNESKKAEFASAETVRLLNRLLRFKKGQQESAAALPEVDLEHSMASLAALVKYLDIMADETNFGQYSLSIFDFTQYMRLDSAASAALHLTSYGAESSTILTSKSGAPRTIAALLNKCRTSGGQRLLAQWIKQPLTDKNRIDRRLNVVETFVNDVQLRQTITEDHLRRMPDYQRLAKKLQKSKANLQDLYKLYLGLSRLPLLVECLLQHDGPHSAVLLPVLIQPLRTANEKLVKLKEMIETTIDLQQADQGEFIVKADFDDQLGELKKELDECGEKAERILSKVVNNLNLESAKSVKLESNGQIGYYFRVTLKDEKNLRNNRNYHTIDTNKSGVRFRNTALEDINETYLRVRREYDQQQQSVVKEILSVAAGYIDPLQYLNDSLSQLDVLTSFAVCSISAPIPYVRPNILEKGSGNIELIQVRHPCMELQDGVNFIPNDAIFHKDGQRFYIITGPNMGGKSTYLRSVGVAVLMAQVGCFVAAESATISIVDAILARVGAGDCHLKGVSTFMAEMIETANITRTATKDSLVIIDELGRGTSTFDGFGLAWAIAEHIAVKIQPCALFATHFHELTTLADEVPSVDNRHVTALTGDNTFTLLYRVQPGSCDQSFGLHVAEMVHFPQEVLQTAKAKAKELEAIQPNNGNESGEPDSKRRRAEIGENGTLLREYLGRAKTIINEKGVKCKEMEELRKEILNTTDPFIRNVLNI
nr:EOG090X02H9 [Ceriodaphnia reticulata]